MRHVLTSISNFKRNNYCVFWIDRRKHCKSPWYKTKLEWKVKQDWRKYLDNTQTNPLVLLDQMIEEREWWQALSTPPFLFLPNSSQTPTLKTCQKWKGKNLKRIQQTLKIGFEGVSLTVCNCSHSFALTLSTFTSEKKILIPLKNQENFDNKI